VGIFHALLDHRDINFGSPVHVLLLVLLKKLYNTWAWVCCTVLQPCVRPHTGCTITLSGGVVRHSTGPLERRWATGPQALSPGGPFRPTTVHWNRLMKLSEPVQCNWHCGWQTWKLSCLLLKIFPCKFQNWRLDCGIWMPGWGNAVYIQFGRETNICPTPRLVTQPRICLFAGANTVG